MALLRPTKSAGDMKAQISTPRKSVDRPGALVIMAGV
jgi:hypothetical protein